MKDHTIVGGHLKEEQYWFLRAFAERNRWTLSVALVVCLEGLRENPGFIHEWVDGERGDFNCLLSNTQVDKALYDWHVDFAHEHRISRSALQRCAIDHQKGQEDQEEMFELARLVAVLQGVGKYEPRRPK